MANVKVRNLTKRFGNVVAVDDLSFDVKNGEFLALLGPSGCGKTSTLRCIAGLETPNEGEIYIEDVMVNELSPKDRDIAMVFQSYALYPHMTVFNNMAFPLKMGKLPKKEIKKKVRSTAKLVRVNHLLDRKPGQLSGGEAQRVALGRACVRDPKVFLMDEPLSNLDAKLRIYMRAELKRLVKDCGFTTIYVTHDQTEALTMADEIAVMNQGRILQLGTTHEIFNHPLNLFVAGFIGSPPMNFIECALEKKNGSFLLNCRSFVLPIPDSISRAIGEEMFGSELILGIRPEDIFLGRKKTPRTFVKAEVYVTEPLGSEIIVNLKVGDKLVQTKTAADFAIGAGEKVWMGLKMEKVHLFDKKGENAIT